MIKDIIKTQFNKWAESAVEILFTRGLTISTALGIAGIIIHNFYPHYADQFDTSLSGILIYIRGKNANTNTK